MFAGENLVGHSFERILRQGIIGLGAQDQNEGRILDFVGPMLVGVVQVHVDLPGVGITGSRAAQSHEFVRCDRREVETFLKAHWHTLAAIDFTTVEVWTKGSLDSLYSIRHGACHKESHSYSHHTAS
jgi:hypothetical protein